MPQVGPRRFSTEAHEEAVSISAIEKPLYLAESFAEIDSNPDVLARLTPVERAAVIAKGYRRRLARHDIIFRQGDAHQGITLIESGCVRQYYVAPSGREITLSYVNGGNFCGVPGMYERGTHSWTAEAASEEVRVLIIPPDALRVLLSTIPALAIGLVDGLVYKGKCYATLLQILGTRSMTKRLMRLVIMLAERYGTTEARGVRIRSHFSHSELANMIGATRQWVSSNLRHLHKHGLICLNDGCIVILDSHQLAVLSE
jgi:CRP/FNR family cyclic AMP-dependent transcriptional regulator